MSYKPNALLTLDSIKRLAKSIKKDRHVKHAEALRLAAIEAGYANYAHAQRALSFHASQQSEQPLYKIPDQTSRLLTSHTAWKPAPQRVNKILEFLMRQRAAGKPLQVSLGQITRAIGDTGPVSARAKRRLRLEIQAAVSVALEHGYDVEVFNDFRNMVLETSMN